METVNIKQNPRELYLIWLALREKRTQLEQIPSPLGDAEKGEYAELEQSYLTLLQREDKKAEEKAAKGGKD